MSNPVTLPALCPNCKTAVDAADNFCRQCGKPTAAGLAGLATWWESPWVILPLLLVVAGPFALPLLWRSRRFTRFWKMALTVIVVGITLWAVWQVWYIVNKTLESLRQLEKTLLR